MDLRRLKYFCAIVEHGSLTKAAQALNMAQPPLSQRLRELEEEVGAELFMRNGRRILPTPAGYHLYQRAGQILRDVENAARETACVAKRQNKLLRIGLSHLFSRYFKSMVLEIHRQNPGMEISLSVADSSHLELLLMNGFIDIALMQRPHGSDSFTCFDLTPVKIVAVASKSLDLSAYGDAIPFAALGKFPLVLLRRHNGPGTYEVILDQFRKNGVNPNVIMQISQPGVLLSWIENGLDGVTILPESEVPRNTKRNYQVLDIQMPPLIFFPSIVKQTTASDVKELQFLMDGSYQFEPYANCA